MSLPKDIAELLWSHDASKVDPERDVKAIVMAVVRLGDLDQMKWLFSRYGWATVERVVGEDYFGPRSLPVSVRAFWGNLFWPDRPPPELTDKAERWRPTRSPAIEEQAASEVRRRLKGALARAGLSQRAFASLLGTSQPRLSSYLSGKVAPSAVLLEKAELIAAALGGGSTASWRRDLTGPGPRPPVSFRK